MGNRKLIKTIGLNILIIIINIFVFSQRFLGIQLSFHNVLEAALGVTVILFSIVVFVIVNTNIVKTKKVKTAMAIIGKEPDIHNLDDSYNELKKYTKDTSSFRKPMETMMTQIERFTSKKQIVSKVLTEKFDTNELTWHKYNSAIENLEKLFQENLKNAIVKANFFDDKDFKGALEAGHIKSDVVVSRKEILQEYNQFMTKVVSDNEEMILKLDRLILEISKLNDAEYGDIKNIEVVKEIEQLIQNTKLYK